MHHLLNHQELPSQLKATLPSQHSVLKKHQGKDEWNVPKFYYVTYGLRISPA